MSNAEIEDAFEGTMSKKSFDVTSAEVSDKGRDLHEEDPGIPWHHLQLYGLFGNDADYYLYPKLTVEKQSCIRPHAHHGLTNSPNTEHGGAKNLWTKLRSDSLRKLYGVDASFSKDLKLTYQAYVREFVSTNENFSKRCMYTAKDVPQLEELTNRVSSLLTQESKHKTEVMWRASRKNKDGTSVLLHNNPLPDLNNWTEDYNIMSYLPALPMKISEVEVLDDASLDSERMENNSDIFETTKACHKNEKKRKNYECVGYEQLQLANIRMREESAMPYKCVFLTSAETNMTGSYSKKRKELLEAKRYAEHLAEDLSCHKLPECHHNKTEIGLPQKCTEPRITKFGHQATSDRQCNDQQAWQPLTLAALLEYRTDVKTVGQDNFSYGHTALWPVI